MYAISLSLLLSLKVGSNPQSSLILHSVIIRDVKKIGNNRIVYHLSFVWWLIMEDQRFISSFSIGCSIVSIVFFKLLLQFESTLFILFSAFYQAGPFWQYRAWSGHLETGGQFLVPWPIKCHQLNQISRIHWQKTTTNGSALTFSSIRNSVVIDT